MKFDYRHILRDLWMKLTKHITRDFLIKRIKSFEPWYFRMSVFTVALAIVIGVALSLCQQTGILFGVEVGLVCAVPMLFILWFPFLLAQFFVEVSRFSGLHFSAPDAFFNSYHTYIPSVFLPVPLSPPRFRLA